MRNELVVDLETKRSFEEVGGQQNHHLLEISLAGIYDYTKGDFFSFQENEVGELVERLKGVDRVIGFNVKTFDWRVLQAYTDFDIGSIATLDIMDDAVRAVGRRVSLNNIASSTLGVRKSGHGLEAIRLFREGKMEELKKYCLDDVRITRDVYEYGLQHNHIYAVSPRDGQKMTIPVKWKEERLL